MPTYVYRREDGTTFEAFQRISDDALEACPETGQPVERVISGGEGLIFKGTGFYLTDYARKGQKPSGGSEGESASETPAKTAKPADKAKPAPAAKSGADE